MLAEPAAALGLPLRLLATADTESAAQVIPDLVLGHHTDLEALLELTAGCAVVTFDHEHVPASHLRALRERSADGVAVHPSPEALAHAQDKAVMRRALTALEVPCPRWRVVSSAAEVVEFGFPAVLKTTRGGYDGRGVWVVRSAAECDPAFAAASAAGVEVLAEELVDFRRELSALVVRAPSGQAAAYPVVESTQVDGICREVVAPAPDLDPDLAGYAQEIALRIAGALDVVGVLAVELFETAAWTAAGSAADRGPGAAAGRGPGRILVNELAMRPHNTGHWTQDGAVTSQFENHLRAVLDLPLGSPVARARWTVMVNILGSPDSGPGRRGPGGAGGPGRLYDGYPHALARDPRLRVHLYGKDLRPGRKVGHVNAYGEDLEDCRERARHAAAWFAGELGDESE